MNNDGNGLLGEGVRRFKRYPAYKDSTLPFVGQIPSHWNTRRLKLVASVRPSNVDKNSVEGQRAVRLCNYVDVYKNDYIGDALEFMLATASNSQIATFGLKSGDVIITKDSESWDDIAVPAFVPEELDGVVCGYHLSLIRSKPDVMDGEYLFRCFSAEGVCDQFRVAANGITRFGLGMSAITDSVFPLPSVDEQRRITRFLKEESAKFDALIAKKERLIELLLEKRTALISHAVTKGLDPNVPMKDSGIGWLGKIPKHWRLASMKWSISIESGQFLPNTSFEIEQSEANPTPVVGGNGVAGFTSTPRFALGVIAIGRVGALCGNVHVIKEPAWITDNALVIQRWRGFDIDYLGMWLTHLNLNQYASQTAQPLVTGSLVKEQPSLRLPLTEQSQIVERCQRVSLTYNTLIANVRDAINKLQEFRTALISSAVTGKIDVREEVA